MSNIDEVIALGTRQGRICPQPQRWKELWELLPNRERKGAGWIPPLPFILAAWWETDDAQKQDRFLAHLRWAEEHGALDTVIEYLSKLQESDWHFKE